MTKLLERTIFIFVATALFAGSALCQENQPAGKRSRGSSHPTPPLPEIKDGDVTFRINAPKASQVTVSGDFASGKKLELTKDEKGAWSVTVHLEPRVYSYIFNV